MKRNILISCIVLIVLSFCTVIVFAGLEVKKDKENVAASRLIGTWKVNKTLSTRLWGEDILKREYVFTEDDSVAAKIPEKYKEFFKDKQIYLAGTVKINTETHPFLLIENKGNPHLVYFRELDGDPMGDAESFNLSLIPARDKTQDLLFIGGDFNNQPFMAYDREQ